MAKVPSLAMTVDFCSAGVDESLRLTCPDSGAPTAAVPLTTSDETPPEPPPQPAIIRPRVIRERTVMAAIDFFKSFFIKSPFKVILLKL